MIGLDTNVLVRYIMQDDVKQSPKAIKLVESLTADAPGFVPLVAIIELIWVLGNDDVRCRCRQECRHDVHPVGTPGP